MPLEYWARGDSSTANNAVLNVRPKSQQDTVKLTFYENTAAPNGGDLKLDYTDGTIADPDTLVWVDYNGDGNRDAGEEMTFTVEFIGYMPAGVSSNGVDLEGQKVMTVTLEDGTRLWFFVDSANDPSYFDIMDNFSNGAQPLDTVTLICFAKGTLIATPEGMRQVETLEPGDCVLTGDGPDATVTFSASQSFTAAEVRAFKGVRPVVVPAGSLRPAEPARDLVVSPLHRIMIDGPELERLFGLTRAYVAARDLPGIRPGPVDDITYVHVLCDRHAAIIAESCISESLFPGDVALLALSRDDKARALALAGDDIKVTAYPCLTAKEAAVWRAEVQSREKRTA